MKMHNSLISFLLIFAYSIGFAHELIPHYHVEDGFTIVKNVEMHHHVSPEERDADDISHNEHLDDGLLDYLVCIISHPDHSNHDEVVVLHQSTSLSIDKFTSADYFQLIDQKDDILVPYQKLSKVFSQPRKGQWMVLCDIQSRRGPPTFS